MDKSDINFVAKVVASKKYVKQWLPFVVVSLVVFIAVIALLMSYLPINIFAVIIPIVALSLLVAVTLGVGIFLRLTNHCIPIDKWRCFIAPCLVAIIFAVALVNVFIPNAKAYSAINSDYSLSNNELTLEHYKGKDEELTLSSTIMWNRREYALKAIGAKAFANSSLKKISIPDSVSEIAPDAFAGCTTIENIIVDENNTKYASADGILYDKAMANMLHFPICKAGEVTFGQHFEDLSFLNGAKNLTKITFLSQVPPSQGAFDTGNADLVVEVPREVYDVYKVSLKDAPVKVEITTTSEERIVYFEHATDGIPTYAIYDENYQAPILTRAGYTFVGWGEQGATTPFNMTKLMKSIRLYPIWTANRNTIVFDSNGGSGAMANQTMATDSQGVLNANTLERLGYSFKGWATTATGAVEYLDMANYTMGADSSYTLYAVWTVNMNTIVFDSNGGSGAMSNQTMATDSQGALNANTLVRLGYSFKGWATTATGTVEYLDMANYSMDVDSSYTLYAVWERDWSYGSPGLEYTALSDGSYSVKQGTAVPENGEIFIPSTYNGNIVTSIGDWAFNWCSALTNITIPSSVTSIGDGAFSNCSALTSITLPSSVTSIGEYAFDSCSALTNVTIPSSVTSIGIGAFEYCRALKEITIPNSVTSIGWRAFFECKGLTSITLPSSVTSIGEYAFDSCSALTNVTIPSSVTSIDIGSFKNCSALTNITIPNSVTSIGNSAFYGCNALTNITIPNSVTSIGYRAFVGCRALTSITIPNSVTSIGDWVFSGCSALTSINVDNNNQKYTSINGNLYTKDKTTLIQYALGKTNTSFVIPNSVTSIGDSAFDGCSALTSITIPSSVTSIGYWAFLGCRALTSITIPYSVISIGKWVFSGCSALTSINVDNDNQKFSSINGNLYNKDKTTLIRYALGKSNTSFVIPNSVTSIGEGAFFECKGLTSITLPSSVTSIGEYAFESCSALTSIIIPSSVTSIGKMAFRYCSALTNVTIPNSVTSIGGWAFDGCSALTNVTIPSSVTSIGYGAFAGCSALTSINVDNDNQKFSSINGNLYNKDKTTLIRYALGKSNTSFVIPNSVTSIGEGAFFECKGLTSITLPSSVTSIGYGAFFGWTNKQTIYIDGRSAPGSGWDISWNYACSAIIVYRPNN